MSLLKKQMSLQQEQNDLLKQLIDGKGKETATEIGLNSVQKIIRLTSKAMAVENTVFEVKAVEALNAEDAMFSQSPVAVHFILYFID